MELDFRKDPQLLASIVDTLAVGVFTVDQKGNFVAWSEGAERITGYSAAEIIGRPCEILSGATCEGFAELARWLSRTPSNNGEIQAQRYKVTAKNGRHRHLEAKVRLLVDDRRVVGAVGTFVDTTDSVAADEKIALLERQAVPNQVLDRIIGKSQAMQELIRQIQLAAATETTVLIRGESGTGKELAAAAIHSLSRRSDRPFLAISAAAIPEAVLESELFGHLEGSWSDATADKNGMFEAAEGGTVFLDDIGHLNLSLQAKLLATIQQHEVRRIGDNQTRKVDVRIIAASDQDLRSLIAQGALDEKFYRGLLGFEICLPPLRDRKEDIPMLVDHFIAQLGHAREGQAVEEASKDALQLLMNYHWPGNVRQLRTAIEHACVTAAGHRMCYLDLPIEIRHPGQVMRGGNPARFDRDERAERERILEVLRETGGNRTQAARLLGTSRVTLWKKMNRYGINVPSRAP